MSNFLAASLELQSSDGTFYFEILSGDPFDPPETRGDFLQVPELAGRYPLSGDHIDDRLVVKLLGVVEGQGATLALKRTAYRTAMGQLAAVMNPSGSLFSLKLYPGADASIPAGHYYQLDNVGFTGWTKGLKGGDYHQQLTLDLESVASPPRWVYH